MHTTNGNVGSKGSAELNYLVNSPNVSAHYFINKSGVIYQVLDPEKYVAWHAGEVSRDAYSNYYAIGVEMHFTPKELYWTGEMWHALTRLAQCYGGLTRVMHRQIARPIGRKIDPSGVIDDQFVNWSNQVNDTPILGRLRVNSNLRSSPKFDLNIVAVLPAKLTVALSQKPVAGDVYNNSNLWYYCNWLGFVHASLIDFGGEL